MLKSTDDQLDWKNPEGDRYPFELIKPLPLVESRNRLMVPADYFFNNDLAYLQGGSTDRTYMTSLTKMKAAKYYLQGIKDMVPTLWSPIKVVYDKHAALDQQLYKFIEGDFPRLHLNDIEDMLLLVVQNRLFNLDGELERNRLMRTYEFYKFSDGTLISVWDKLKDMANNLELGYNSVMLRRRWSNLDKKRSRIMVKDIDYQLLERRLLRSLEKFVGGREYREDLRLLKRTI
ncbi:hypothetical protein Tco_0806050 [Tanacetum coccineum]